MNDAPNQIEIYTDGACSPNPGPGGWAAVLLHPIKRMEISGGFRRTTINRMEIFAAIKALEMLKRPCKVTLHSNSQYLVQAMMAGWVAAWKKKNWWRTRKQQAVNTDLWQRLLAVSEKHEVTFIWVPGHAGVKENERCDVLSSGELLKSNLPFDDGYENRPDAEQKREITEDGQFCLRCEGPVVKIFRSPSKKIKPQQTHYFEFQLKCPQCGLTYSVEAARREIGTSEFLLH